MDLRMKLKVVYLDNYHGGKDNEKLKYAKLGDSGFDLRAGEVDDGVGYWLIPPNTVRVIPAGIKVAVPVGYEMQVRTRSGSPLKSDFFVANSPGTVDSGYRGEVGTIVYNFSNEPVTILPGDRIAQGVICPVECVEFDEVTDLDETERGDGAYNSTGIK